MHATQTLIAFGRTYFDLHRAKDAPVKSLGREHRAVNHDWYQAGRAGLWTADEPFPAWVSRVTRDILLDHGPLAAEEYQVDLSHDYADFIWDGLGKFERRYQESIHCWIVLHPEHLMQYGQVDVHNGRIHRFVEGQDIWEYDPLLIGEYGRLRRYVESVLRRDSQLRAMIEYYG